jgi:hypothetical protein
MDYPTTIIGVMALGFALFTFTLRVTNPTRLKRLQTLKERLGKIAGSVVHEVFYIALPLGFGGFCLVSSYKGMPLF